MWRHCALLLTVIAAGGASVRIGAGQPNLVVLLTDDQTYRAIGYHNAQVKTPHLDRLASDGMRFSHAYVASPICAASRASILTGLYPQQHQSVALSANGFIRNVVRDQRYQTLAQCLQAVGYTTGFCGKSHLGDPRQYGFAHGRADDDIKDETAFAFAQAFVNERAKDEKPFLLWIALKQPHLPLRPEPCWLKPYAGVIIDVAPNYRPQPLPSSLLNQGLPGELYYRDSNFTKNYQGLRAGPPRLKQAIRAFTLAYFATISRLDHQIGRLVGQLEETGLDDTTVIVFLSDNGYLLGNHGLGNKITMHEESVRVPMFIRDPRLATRGGRSTALVSSLDIFPTLMELAGSTPPPHVWGTSLVPLLKDPTHSWRDFVASECVGVGGQLGTGHRMIRTKRWKYMLSGINEEALFDELADPYELRNLAADQAHRTVLVEMRSRMRCWMKSIGDTHTPPPNGASHPR